MGRLGCYGARPKCLWALPPQSPGALFAASEGMHTKDDRYANFFLFTEQEVEILCGAKGHVRSLLENLI
jgi:hypothetical protein